MSKIIKQLLSILLVLAFVINLLPLNVLALDTSESVQVSTSNDALDVADSVSSAEDAVVDAQTGPIEVVEEDLSKRSEFYKEFILSNGLRLATIYPDAIHYEEDGQWKDIDNTLTAKVINGQAVYTNTAGLWDVRFPQQMTNSNTISIIKDGYTVSFGMAGEMRSSGDLVVASVGLETDISSTNTLTVGTVNISTAQIQQIDTASAKAAAEFEETIPDKLYSKLVYPTVYNNTNIVYDLSSNQLKESVIIQSYDAALWGYRYELNTGGLVPMLNDDQSIDLCDPITNAVVMTMPAPFMLDANDEYCDEVAVSLVQKGTSYLLSYYLPQEWMGAEDRAWPVVLDPVVSANNDRTNIQDITVAENDTESNNATTIKCGYHLTKGILRTYLRYEILPALSSADVIVSASVKLIKPYDSTLSAPIEVHKVNAAWEASATSWSNKPAFNSTIEDIIVVQDPATYTWDITDIVRGWYADTSNALLNNTGMMFKATDKIENAGEKNWQQFCSSDFGSDRPILTIKYYTTSGLEDYWDTTSSSAGRAGTGYVQNYSGNLVWVHNDIGFDGNRMPVSISHVYNAHDAWDEENSTGYNPFGMGNGWRTNFNQRIFLSASSTYMWEDGDGTAHEFTSTSSSTYKDGDDLGLTLSVSSSGYTLTDKYGNKSIFDTSGRLTNQVNNQSTTSSIKISYQSTTSNLISQILDGVDRKYTFTYSGGLLSQITYYGTGSTALSYVKFGYTNSNLTSITYKDDAKSTFSYTTKNLMSSATDIDGYKITYSYNTLATNKPSRVASVTESHNGTTGSKMTIAYAYNRTTLTDHEGNAQTYFFNVWGNATSVQNSEGNATFYQYATDINSFATKHRLVTSSQQQDTVTNLIKDHSFESGTNWTTMFSQDTCTNSSAGAYLGSKGLKITCNSFIGSNGAYSGTYTAAPGESYTFSAYVKCGSTKVQLRIVDDTDKVASSDIFNATTSTAWNRLEVTYTNETTESRTIRLYLINWSSGTVYMDCIQLEKSEGASRYNLAENSDFLYVSGGSPYGWVLYPDDEYKPSMSATSNPPSLTPNCIRIDGGKEGVQCVYQTVPVSGSAGDTFVFSGWARGDALPATNSTRAFRIFLMFTYQDDSIDETFTYAYFNPHLTDGQWQYLAAYGVAEHDYKSVTIRAEHSFNANTVYFDGLQLFKEEFGETYSYDASGNVTKVTDSLGQPTTYTYNTKNDLIETQLPTLVKTVNTYDNYHNVTKSVKQYGEVDAETEEIKWTDVEKIEYVYDVYGNVKSQSSTADGVTKTTSATYTDNGNFPYTTTDADGNVTTYNYDANRSYLTWVQYPNDTSSTRTYYVYDSDTFRLVRTYTTTDQGVTMSANYTYSGDNLTKISTPSTNYNLSYGSFGLRTGVSVGSTNLAEYKYSTDQNHHLIQLDYGNGDVVKYTYDDLGRVTVETYYENGSSTASRTVTYAYDNTGALATMTDSKTGITTKYYYDSLGRPTAQVETAGSMGHSLRYTYNALGQVAQLREYYKASETANAEINTSLYTYDVAGRLQKLAQGLPIEYYTYDNFDRVTSEIIKHGSSVVLNTSIIYDGTSDRITQQVLDAYGLDRTYRYTYDSNGNILSVNDGSYITSYVYDSQNQLIRENNARKLKTWVWTYDESGNITSKKEYYYTTGTLGTVQSTITYGYDSTWGDKLISYNGKSITYDAIGNPLSDGSWNYTWEQGRQLVSMSYASNIWNFTYDANGMRTGRTNTGTTYTYTYNGSQLSRMYSSGGGTMRFTYSADGTPQAISYGSSWYYYATNLQGDVIAILDNSGNPVVYYYYDAWGKLLNTTGSMASTLGLHNPLRYRGYVYDRETGLYYLQSRYYNPTIGRFINADSLAYLGADGTPLSYNLFAYCKNNPVNCADTHGTFINTITGALIGGIIGGISAAIAGDDILAGIGIGAGTGALAGLAADVAIATGGVGAIAIAAIGGAAASGINYAATETVNGRKVDMGTLALEMTVGAAANLLTFGVGGGSLKPRGGKLFSNVAKDFTSSVMKGTTKTVAGKTVSRATPIVRKMVISNLLTETANTAAISVGAWFNSKAWGMLL